MTLKDKATIQTIVDNDGCLEDTKFKSVWQYDSSHTGERLYACFYSYEHDMFISPYVENPVLLWSDDEGKIRNPS